MAYRLMLALILQTALIGICHAEDPASQDDRRVGSPENGRTIVPTGQAVRPAGSILRYFGRPLDMALSADQKTLFVKDTAGLTIVDAATWEIRQRLPFKDDADNTDAGSMHGIAVAPDGNVYLTGAKHFLWHAIIDPQGKAQWARQIPLPGPDKKPADALGLAISADGKSAYICLSRNNTIGVIDLIAGKLTRQIDVGICPYDIVLLPNGKTAYISNFGGARPTKGQKTADTAGSEMIVDDRGIGASGTLSKIDLAAGKSIAEITVGLHPAGMVVGSNPARLFVANANSDSVSCIDLATDKVIEEIPVRPDPLLPFGSITNALALSHDGKSLFVANGGNNALAVVVLSADANQKSAVKGFLPTAWFPGAVLTDGKSLFVANVKGDGSRNPSAVRGGAFDRIYNSTRYVGSLSRIDLAELADLKKHTAQVLTDARVPQALLSLEKARSDIKPLPVPARVGEPSVFEHVVYIIKENRTYDQVLGELPKGNGDPRLCIFGREITPNHHALADQFVLLDNYYCNGVISADGHQWATQGLVSAYQEKGFGGFARSYDFGTDALCYASSNFLWDSALLAGRSFRNYGEFDFPDIVPAKATWGDAWKDQLNGTSNVTFKQKILIDTLKKYTSPIFPGWEMKFSDQYRVDQFLKEFRAAEKTGQWENLVIIYLPQDHTSGTKATAPSPRAHLADNDLALGRLIEAISKSRFWDKTCIFVNEDDPQDGFDHVDGHRSLCLVASPYTKRGQVVSKFYNQTSVLHTMERMLGLPTMNQQVAQAPTMEDCFIEKPDLAPFITVPVTIALDEPNKKPAAMTPTQRALAIKGEKMDLSEPDLINDDVFNRILWHAARGEEPYPTKFAGAHGGQLEKLGLKLERAAARKDADDDDDK